jgi:uncharacterized membrane protein
MPTELMVLKFKTPTGAKEMLDVLKGLQAQDFIELLDAVIITKDANQQVHVSQPLEVGPARGTAFGAVTGAVVGLLAGPAGAVLGLVSGAVTGGLAAAAMEAGLPEHDIEAVASGELKPGESALMVYFDQIWIEQIQQAVSDFGATIQRQVVNAVGKVARDYAAEVRKEKIDAAYQSWQASIDKQRQSLAALGQQVSNTVQSDRKAIQQQVDAANAKLHALYTNVLHTLQVWQQQLEASISQLEAEAKQATGQAKADIDQRLAAAKQARQTARADAKATLTTRLNNLKAEIERLKTQAANARGAAKDKLDKQVAALQANWDAEQKKLDKLDDAYGAAWDTLVKSVDEALDKYDAAARAAEAEYTQAAV